MKSENKSLGLKAVLTAFLAGSVAACGGGGGGSSSNGSDSNGGTSPTTGSNRAPSAYAGYIGSHDAGDQVSLDGSASDLDGDWLTYRWEQIGGSPRVTIRNARSEDASFTAPSVTVETELRFRFTVSDPHGATDSDTVTATVRPDLPQVSISDASWREGFRANTVTLAVELSEPANGEATVECVTADQTAESGADYQPVDETITISSGSTTGECTVRLVNDSEGERTETFRVDLENSSANIWLGRRQATVTVYDDDFAATNDTGVTECRDRSVPAPECSANPGQDAESGRDATNPDSDDGAAGFAFAHLDGNGNQVPLGDSAARCARDEVTGLVWELKTRDGGLHDRDREFSGEGRIAQELVDAANSANGGSGLCGFTGWRVPTASELLSIVDYSEAHDFSSPAIETNVFPNATLEKYASSTRAVRPGYPSQRPEGWRGVDFREGKLTIDLYDALEHRVRLVVSP